MCKCSVMERKLNFLVDLWSKPGNASRGPSGAYCLRMQVHSTIIHIIEISYELGEARCVWVWVIPAPLSSLSLSLPPPPPPNSLMSMRPTPHTCVCVCVTLAGQCKSQTVGHNQGHTPIACPGRHSFLFTLPL